ncbi:TetR/AcrR family transcriptional regulator, partial [Candidatus Entotheonella palauensis]
CTPLMLHMATWKMGTRPSGQRLLSERSYDGITLQEVARGARCSIGAFYHHFTNKDVFYTALVERSVTEVREELFIKLGAERFSGMPIAAVMHAVVGFVAEAFRTHQGVVRAVQKTAMDAPEAWNPIRELGSDITDHVSALLTSEAVPGGGHHNSVAVAFAMQLIYSTLLNAVINHPGEQADLERPGPLRLESDEIVHHLTHAAVQYLAAPISPASEPGQPD